MSCSIAICILIICILFTYLFNHEFNFNNFFILDLKRKEKGVDRYIDGNGYGGTRDARHFLNTSFSFHFI